MTLVHEAAVRPACPVRPGGLRPHARNRRARTGRARPVAAAPADASGPRRIEADVRFLADDLLEGRAAGTRGYDLASLYVANRYRAIGLAPAGDDGTYFQNVPLLEGAPPARRRRLHRAARRTATWRSPSRTSSCRA